MLPPRADSKMLTKKHLLPSLARPISSATALDPAISPQPQTAPLRESAARAAAITRLTRFIISQDAGSPLGHRPRRPEGACGVLGLPDVLELRQRAHSSTWTAASWRTSASSRSRETGRGGRQLSLLLKQSCARRKAHQVLSFACGTRDRLNCRPPARLIAGWFCRRPRTETNN